MAWWVLPWVAFTAGVAVLACLLVLLDHCVDKADRGRLLQQQEGDHSMNTTAGRRRRAGILTALGLASAGAALGLAKLLQADLESGEDDHADDPW